MKIMPTLEQMGLCRVGNYLTNIPPSLKLNQSGIEYYNKQYPATKPIFTDETVVIIEKKLPQQENERLTVSVKFVLETDKIITGLVFASEDDHFENR